MGIWFTSDTHFGHTNVIKYCNRPFKDTQEMDEALVEKWNSRIKPQDTVYHLGDFSFRENRDWFNPRMLRGKKILIRGNHDKKINKDIWNEVHNYYELKVNKQMFVLSHYPFLEWNKGHRGSIHLHGHCHGNRAKDTAHLRMLDVGVDCHDYGPLHIDEVVDLMKDKKGCLHHE